MGAGGKYEEEHTENRADSDNTEQETKATVIWFLKAWSEGCEAFHHISTPPPQAGATRTREVLTSRVLPPHHHLRKTDDFSNCPKSPDPGGLKGGRGEALAFPLPMPMGKTTVPHMPRASENPPGNPDLNSSR